MLQTSLMAKQGYSPDVTPSQVDDFYKAHADQFGNPPADPQERKSWWLNVDIAIRNQIATQMRAEYDAQLKAYLADLEVKANITRSTPSATSFGNSAP